MRPSVQGQNPGSLREANGEQDFTNNRVRMVKASGKMDNTVNSSQLSLHCSYMGFGLCAIYRHKHLHTQYCWRLKGIWIVLTSITGKRIKSLKILIVFVITKYTNYRNIKVFTELGCLRSKGIPNLKDNHC